MDFPVRQDRYPMVKLVGIIAAVAFSLLGKPDRCPAVESPLPARLSLGSERMTASASLSAAGTVPSAKRSGDGNTVYVPISVQSRTYHRPRGFQHILQNTPKDHGLAPEKSHDADVSMK
ncbi:MAG: hypothetical protein V1792_13805 [Pseudomonadota bacterium]